MSENLVNRVAKSGIITLDLEKYLPAKDSISSIDLKQFLVQEIALMEKPFRQSLEDFSTEAFTGKEVALYCSADAILPHWAYMLIAAKLSGIAEKVYFMKPEELLKLKLIDEISRLNPESFESKRVVVKGCNKPGIDAAAYIAITNKLLPVVKSLMYGEPCSTVPVYKKKT
ncbi:MAG: DUF2480 family protein [Chitinophagaceae bacterium]|nr:MAG: DUF2480 family protein [Chitinophagaceae bacterium]